MNAGMEQYLRVFVNHQQDDCVQRSPLVEVAMNNAMSESTKCMLFFAVQGVDPRMSFAGKATQEIDQWCLDADQGQATMQRVYNHLGVKM